MKKKHVFYIFLGLIYGIMTKPICAQEAGKQDALHFAGETSLNYLLYLPENYSADSEQGFPLILFLHGSGERGDSIELVKKWGPPKIAAEKGLPFIVLSPQCPETEWWTSMLFPLHQLLDEIIANYAVDTSRIYLTGLSMGGFGTFSMSQVYADYFAAIAPVCGGGTPGMVKFSKNLPTWIFHGEVDEVVPVANSQMMYDALKEAGAEVKLTIFPGVNHDSWIPAYNDSGLFDWFLEHQKK